MQKLRLITSLISMLTFLVSSLAYSQSHSCPSGQFWDARVNRCMITLNNAKVKQATTRCQGLSGDAFKKCFNDNANDQVKALEDNGKMEAHANAFSKGNKSKIAIPLTMTLISSYYLFLNKDKFKDCKNTSLWLLFGAGAVSLVGEASAQITLKWKTKDLASKYKEKMSNYKREKKYDIMTKNQALAFDYLIEAENARLSAEKIRKGAYTLASLLYASTVAMALVESAQVGLKQGAACSMTTTSSTIQIKNHYQKMIVFNSELSGYEYMENMTTLEFIEILARKVYANITISSAHAGGDKFCAQQGLVLKDGECVPKDLVITSDNTSEDDKKNSGIKNAASSAVAGAKGKLAKEIINGENFLTNKAKGLLKTGAGKKQLGFIDKAIATPYVRAALATVLGLYANKLRKDAKENIIISKNRIELLKKMRNDFVASGGAGLQMCTESDRSNKEKPYCFCYKEDGNFDPMKMKLSMCTSLKKEFNLKKAKKYGWIYGKMEAVKVCINQKNQMDTFCKCKSKKSSKGKGNSCAKVSSSLNLRGLAGNSWLKGVISPADSLLNGKLDGSQLNISSLNKNAIALQKKIDKMGKSPKYRSNYKKMKNTGLKLQNAHKAWFKKSFGNSLPKSLASMASSSAKAPSSLKEVIDTAKKNIAKSKGISYGKAGSALGAAANKQNNLDFNWDSDSSAEGGIKVDEIAKVMDTNYAIKGDINKNPNHNIFKILSNRYQRSGLRRLFDTSGTSTADEADKSDINEK